MTPNPPTSKIITIKTCSACPHIDHGGAWGQVAYVPCCEKSSRREMPYTTHASGNRVVARCTDVIPDWCPLENAIPEAP
ncbi:hypothetical protein LCGC14_2198170 [marine sediment metagenome]|uniref:Uncharacterized protein n=1 Tax=marine sediment metagenome TaxID=412755 RepID=A0A0F9DHH1_9ZZZZ